MLWLLAPLAVLIVFTSWFELRYVDRVYPGVQALGVDLSGMDWETASASLSEAARSYDHPPLALRHGDQVWPLRMNAIGAQVDVQSLTQQAFAVGRSSSLPQNLYDQWRAYWFGQRVEPELLVSPGAVSGAIASFTSQLNHPVTEPKLSLSDLQVVVSAPRPGQMVDYAATRNEVLERLEAGRGGVIDVAVQPLLPIADADTVTAGQEAIQQLLERPIVLADGRGDFQFALDPATLSTLLEWQSDNNVAGGLRPVMQQERLRALVEAWARQVARPPLNARFDFEPKSGSLIELSPSAEGYALDVEATIAAILDAIATGKSQLTLPVQVMRPAVASEDAPNFGIKELVVEGVTRFAGSSASRVRNIEVAASKFVGVVIPPDGVFSFNEYVGDVTAANGFEDSLIIAGDRTAVGVGGGVCQVSTTVFRAAWFGGFPIKERSNHGYVVSWYGAPGLDATIYSPVVDFKFTNTTGHYLLLKPLVDSANGEMRFQFYGAKPNWRVEAAQPVYTNRVAPPTPLYIEDPELAPGQVVQVDWAVEGLDASAKRRVVGANDAVLIDQTLKSHYAPWRAMYRFGAGYTPPAGAEVVRASGTS